MLKTLSIALLAFLGTCSAQEAHTLTPIDGTSRILMVFSPDSNSANFKRQLAMIQHHSFELSSRNTVVVPVADNPLTLSEYFDGENLPLVDRGEQAYARSRYRVAVSEFVVLLLNEDGAEEMRSLQPVDIGQLTAKLDGMPRR
jgi:hypothetical protein